MSKWLILFHLQILKYDIKKFWQQLDRFYKEDYLKSKINTLRPQLKA